MTASKAERGHALLHGGRDGIGTPVRATAIALADEATTEEALAALMRGCLQQIAANAPDLLADDDPEWVHQMRIGMRRLRSCLRARRAVRALRRDRTLRGDVKWLAGALGTARDWDVFVRETLPPLAAWFARDAPPRRD